MRIILILVLSFASGQVSACGDTEDFHIGGYSRYPEKANRGSASNKSGDLITINTTFVDNLLKNPSGKVFNKNKYELFYLIAIKDKKALIAAIYVLLDMLKNPEYIIECDKKVQLYGIKELAFNIGRSEDANSELCKLNPNDWTLLMQFYSKDIQLWGYGYDFPRWEDGYKAWCG